MENYSKIRGVKCKTWLPMTPTHHVERNGNKEDQQHQELMKQQFKWLTSSNKIVSMAHRVVVFM